VRKALFSISDPLDAWLREEAARLGISVSELVRRILDTARQRSERGR